jgi:hypothetical protein
MTDFLNSVRLDLLSRRLLPFVALLLVALAAAVAYAVMGGSKGSSPTPAALGPSAPTVSGAGALPVTVAPANPNLAVSETPGGLRYQSRGPTRDPFVPLPSPPAEKSTGASSSTSASGNSTSSSSGGSSSGAGGSSGGSSGGGQEAPAPTPAPKKPAKSTQSPYVVAVLFGRLSTTPGQPTTLTPYESLKLLQPLPTKQDALVSFERVTASGSGAVFKLVVPPIVHGSGICLPSTSECEAVALEVGHAEELEYVDTSGQVLVYELKVVSITKRSAAASAARVRRDAKAARAQPKPRATQAIGAASALRVSVARG